MAKVKKNSYCNQMVSGYLLILPAVVLFAVFFIYSLGQAIHFSMLDWDGVSKQVNIGFENYLMLFNDPVFWQAFLNNWEYTIGIMTFGVFPGLILAYILSNSGILGRTFFRSVFFFPRVVTAVIYGVVWKWMYDPRNGLFLKIVDIFGGDSSNFAILGNTKSVMLGITITGGWTYFGFCMVIFLAAFMSLDSSLEESAIIDGANKLQLFHHITIPQIKPVLNTVIVYTVIDSFKVYDLVLVMTNGGPDNASQIMTYYIFKQAFTMNRFGYGSAAAILLGIFMVVFAVMYNRTFEKEDA